LTRAVWAALSLLAAPAAADRLPDWSLIRAEVRRVYVCPPCPLGAMCKPCAPEHIAVAERAKGPETVVVTGRAASFRVGRRYRLLLRSGEGRSQAMGPAAKALAAFAESDGPMELDSLSELAYSFPDEPLRVSARVAKVFSCPPCPPGAACERCQAARVYIEGVDSPGLKGELLLGDFERKARSLRPGKVYRFVFRTGAVARVESAHEEPITKKQ